MLRVGPAGEQIDVIVGAARLARIDAVRGVAACRLPLCRLSGLRLPDEHAAAVMHDRILHSCLQAPALTRRAPLIERADDAECEQHAGAGVADCRPRLDRLAVALAGNAHRAAASLRDRVEAQPLFVRAARTKPLYLRIDYARVEGADDIVAETQSLDSAGRKVLGEDIGLLGHLLDQRQAPLGF